MSESANVPNVRGPTPPQDSSKGTPVDQEKFKKLMKVEESDEAQKRKKRNLTKQEEGDEEEVKTEQAAPTQGLFSSLLKAPSKSDSIFSVTEPLSLPSSIKESELKEQPPTTPISSFQAQNIQNQVKAVSSEESGDFFFIPNQTHDYVTELPPDIEEPDYSTSELDEEESPVEENFDNQTSNRISQDNQTVQETKPKEISKKEKDKKILKKKPTLQTPKKAEEKGKEQELKTEKTEQPEKLERILPLEKEKITPSLKKSKKITTEQKITTPEPILGKEKILEPKSKETISQEPVATTTPQPTDQEKTPRPEKKPEELLKQSELPQSQQPTQTPTQQPIFQPSMKPGDKSLLEGGTKPAEDDKKGSIKGIGSTKDISEAEGSSNLEEKDGEKEPSSEEGQIESIEGANVQPALQSVEASPDVEMPAYSKLSPDVFDIFQRMVGMLTIQKYSGISTTTIEINNPKSMFDSGKLVLEHYDTAPHAFNVEFQGNESQVTLFNENITDLLAAIQHAKLSYTVNVRRAILAPTYRVEAKEDLTKETKK